MTQPWYIKGDFLMNCNCEVFCPCVLSLGKANPTYDKCLSWWGIHISEGRCGDMVFDGITVAILLEVPGPLVEGGWTVGLYISEHASDEVTAKLEQIFSGNAGGPISWFSIMIYQFLGTKKVPITFEQRGKGWYMGIPKIIDGYVEPVTGSDGETPMMTTNTGYWAGRDVVVSRGVKSRIRDHGRNWDFSGKSAEYAKIDWSGP